MFFIFCEYFWIIFQSRHCSTPPTPPCIKCRYELIPNAQYYGGPFTQSPSNLEVELEILHTKCDQFVLICTANFEICAHPPLKILAKAAGAVEMLWNFHPETLHTNYPQFVLICAVHFIIWRAIYNLVGGEHKF